MSKFKIEVPKEYRIAFEDIYEPKLRLHLWYSPRASWKSSGLSRLMYVYYLHYVNYDIIVGVDSLSNAGDGVLNEFKAFIESNNLNDNNEWIFSNKEIKNKRFKHCIRAYAVQTNALQI
ncbi:MAG: hypothetical protein FWF56_06005 [Firmicutes bacterium]|nr:hypothetical protein [Bacillota bacterium]